MSLTQANQKLWVVIHRMVAVNFKILDRIELREAAQSQLVSAHVFLLMDLFLDSCRSTLVEVFTGVMAV